MMHLSKLGLLCALLALTGGPTLSPASAQTGPTTTPTPPNGGQTTQPGRAFTDEALASYLRAQGYKVEERKLANGRTLCVTTIEKDGWRFLVELQLTQNLKSVEIMCHLGNPLSPGRATAEQLLKLMEASRTQVGRVGFFTYRSADNRLLLFDIASNDTARFGSYLDGVLKDVMASHPLWSVLA
jgi:hypothetical protein